MTISPLTEEIKEYILRYMKRYRVPGVSVALVWRSSEEHAWQSETYCEGIATVKGNKVTPETIFCIASNSKVITSIAIGLLIDRKTKLPNGEVLEWETKVKDALPEFELVDKYAQENITVADLLCHTSGLPRHDILLKNQDTTSRVVSALQHVRPCRQLRQKMQYANVNYYTAGEIVVKLSKSTSFPAFVQENILDPLGMGSSMYDGVAAAETGRRADGYIHVGRDASKGAHALKRGEWSDDVVGEVGTFGWFSDGTADVAFAPAGSLSTTADDMAKWVKELLDPQIIPKDALKEIVKARVVSDPSPSIPELSPATYGLGQNMQTYRGVNTEGHGGGLSGFSSMHVRVPGKLGVMIMSNDGELGYNLGSLIGYKLIDQIMRLGEVDWEEKLVWKQLSEVKEYDPQPKAARTADERIQGSYWHDGYEALDITPLEASNVGETIKVLLKVDPLRLIPLPPDGKGMYIAKTGRMLQSHLLFAPFDGPIYRWVRIYLRTLLQRVGPHTHVVEVWGSGKAVVTDNGIGMFEGFWGLLDPCPTKKAVEDQVEEAAEVWYRRK